MDSRGMQSGQVPPAWMPPQSGTFRNPLGMESGQFSTAWMPPQYGTVNNTLGCGPPPQSENFYNPPRMESTQFPNTFENVNNPSRMESGQFPANRMPLASPLPPAYPPTGTEPRVPFTHMMYNQVPAGDNNPPEGMYLGPSLAGRQPAGGTFRPSSVSQPVKLPRGMNPSVFYGHMNSWHLRSLDAKQAAATVCPVSVPSKTDTDPRGMDLELFRAANKGDVKRLKLLSSNVDVFSQITPAGDTALHIAASNGHYKFVEELLNLPGEQFQFLKAKNREGNTALHVAAVHGNAKIVQALVDKYKDLDHENNVDYRDLVYEINGTGETALFKAAEEGHAEIVEKLLEFTPPAYNMKRSVDDQTPLHRAVFKAKKDVINKLIAKRRELLRETDNEGLTPLHIAAFRAIPKSPPPLFHMRMRKAYGQIRQIFKILIKEDSSVCYMVDNNKQNPLHLAVINGNAGLMQEILRNRKDCSAMVDSVGRNVLHLAVENAAEIFQRMGPGIRDIIIPDFLRKEFINCTDNFGRTPFDIVTENASTDPQLFLAIGNLLERCGGHPSPKWLQRKPRNFSPPVITTWNSQIISVNAVLLATVAFAVAFTLPGNHDSAEINSSIFQVLVIFDALAFCFSTASALLLVYALFISKVEDPMLTQKSMDALRVALVSTGITFGAAIHMVVAPKCLWLAVVVWVMISYLPIWIVQLSTRGKLYLFHPPIVILINLTFETFTILLSLCDPMLSLVMVFVGAIKFICGSLAKKIREIAQ